ncbi:MAG: hypothetical protein BWZ10_00749 [candidate division BRC1 bacterium ADurb.BinA364]|nr:MAG: hypothetical protein BWZ10_00749 [candidate division BRC1 bacterium ADurb.BinA364]
MVRLFAALLIPAFFAVCASALGASPALPAPALDLIRQAGNAADDAERAHLLRELADRADFSDSLREDARAVLLQAEMWTGQADAALYSGRQASEKGYLNYFIPSNDIGFGHSLGPDSPLYALDRFYLARKQVWRPIESGGIYHTAEALAEWFGEAKANFEIARQAFPDNPIVGMYLGEPIPWPIRREPLAQAPDWANHQREALEGLVDIVHWWIDNRLREDGQYGGGWGDDCEMWRWWMPVLIAFEDSKIIEAQERFSRQLLAQPHMSGGYTSRMSDVEHTSEDSMDTITPMMHLRPDEAEWPERARRLAELFETQWSGINERGFRQFKSTYFTSQTVSGDSAQACDTPYHTCALQPAFVAWLRTGDQELGRILTSWLRTWIDATARGEEGKPAGVIPAAIHWPDGRPRGQNDEWWFPNNYNQQNPLYLWPSAVSRLTDALALAYCITDDETFLEPIRSMVAIWRKYRDRPAANAEPGSEAWCAASMSFLPGTLAKLRVLRGERDYDDVLERMGGYAAYLATGNREAAYAGLEKSARAVRWNFEAYTSEVRFTDRVIAFPGRWPKYWGYPADEAPSAEALFSAATGDPGGALLFPLNAVRWLTPPREIAAFVAQSSPREFEAELFHFGASPRRMGAELLLLKPGEYRADLRDAMDSNRPALGQDLRVEGPRARIEFELPPRRLLVLTIAPKDARQRP